MQIVDTSEAAFKAWLVKNAFGHVGDRCDPKGCAFARFLTDLGFKDVSVGPAMVRTYQSLGDGLTIKNDTASPTWLARFIRKFDSSPGSAFTGVTGAEALKYLEVA